MAVMPTTTVRVPRGLHARLAEQADQRRTSMAGVIEQALAALADDEFWRAARDTMESREAAAQVRADLADWDETLTDGLAEEDWSWLV